MLCVEHEIGPPVVVLSAPALVLVLSLAVLALDVLALDVAPVTLDVVATPEVLVPISVVDSPLVVTFDVVGPHAPDTSNEISQSPALPTRMSPHGRTHDVAVKAATRPTTSGPPSHRGACCTAWAS